MMPYLTAFVRLTFGFGTGFGAIGVAALALTFFKGFQVGVTGLGDAALLAAAAWRLFAFVTADFTAGFDLRIAARCVVLAMFVSWDSCHFLSCE